MSDLLEELVEGNNTPDSLPEKEVAWNIYSKDKTVYVDPEGRELQLRPGVNVKEGAKIHATFFLPPNQTTKEAEEERNALMGQGVVVGSKSSSDG